MAIKIHKNITAYNRWEGRAGYDVEWITLHYTANTWQPDLAKNEAAAFANKYVGASAHYFVDTSEIWQSVEIADTAWHCGDAPSRNGCINRNSIGIEMCVVYKDGVYSIPDATVNLTAELVWYLLEMFPNAKLCRHYDVTGKVCPQPWVANPALWDNFQKKIKEEAPMTKQEKAEFEALKARVAALATKESNNAENIKRLANADSKINDDVKKLGKGYENLDERTRAQYNSVEECPDWARPTVKKLVDEKYLRGVNAKGDLALTTDLTRTLVVIDRSGGFDD